MKKRRIIFDLNGTLFETIDYKSRLKVILEEFGINYSEDELKGMLIAMKNYEDYYNHYTIELYRRHLSNLSGVDLSDDFIKYFLSRSEILAPNSVSEEVLDILDYLKLKYDLVVLTNYFAYAQYEQMQKKDIAKYFSEVFGGEENIKPSPESFLKATLPYEISECVMIGDDLKKDIMGAKNIGLDAIYYNKNGSINSEKKINNMKYLKRIL